MISINHECEIQQKITQSSHKMFILDDLLPHIALEIDYQREIKSLDHAQEHKFIQNKAKSE